MMYNLAMTCTVDGCWGECATHNSKTSPSTSGVRAYGKAINVPGESSSSLVHLNLATTEYVLKSVQYPGLIFYGWQPDPNSVAVKGSFGLTFYELVGIDEVSASATYDKNFCFAQQILYIEEIDSVVNSTGFVFDLLTHKVSAAWNALQGFVKMEKAKAEKKFPQAKTWNLQPIMFADYMGSKYIVRLDGMGW